MHRFCRGLWGLAAALSLAAVQPAAAQESPRATAARALLQSADSGTTFIIGTRDGSSFFGRVTAVRGDTITITTPVASMSIRLADVVSASAVDPADIHAGVYWFPNPNVTRLLFAPTGRMLKKGNGYFSDYMLVFPGVAYGISDRVTIGGGMSIVPGLGIEDQLFYATPKIGVVSTPRVNVAVGVLALHAGLGSDEFDESDANAGVLYTVGTFGGVNASVTGGIGFGYADGAVSGDPAVMIGGEARLSRRVGVVTENYYFSAISDHALLSVGLRFFGEKLSTDFGLVIPTGESVAIPFVGFVANF